MLIGIPMYLKEKGLVMTYITAHAGLENTKPGTWEDVEKAIELNADILEVDVRMYEGKVYLSHDPLNIESLEEYLLLEEVLERIKSTNIMINCDIKEKETTKEVAEIAERLHLEKRLFFTGASDINFLNKFNKFHYFVGTEYAGITGNEKQLSKKEIEELIINFRKNANPCCRGFNLDYNTVSLDLIEALAKAKIPLSCWTVDKRADIDFLLRNQIPYITTNRVKYAMEQRRQLDEAS